MYTGQPSSNKVTDFNRGHDFDNFNFLTVTFLLINKMFKIENMTSTTMAPIQVQNFKFFNISLIRGLRFATTTSDQF